MLAEEGQLMSYYHDGFWQCMDTQREMKKLEALWQSGKCALENLEIKNGREEGEKKDEV